MKVDRFRLSGDLFFIGFDFLLIGAGFLQPNLWFLKYVGFFMLGASIMNYYYDLMEYKKQKR